MKMKREDLVSELHSNGRMSMREANKVMDAILEERERLFRNMDLEVRTSPIHGRGVFARREIPAKAILEECHFIQLKEKDFENLDPVLKDYVFSFPRGSKDDARTYAIPLGCLQHYQSFPRPSKRHMDNQSITLAVHFHVTQRYSGRGGDIDRLRPGVMPWLYLFALPLERHGELFGFSLDKTPPDIIRPILSKLFQTQVNPL